MYIMRASRLSCLFSIFIITDHRVQKAFLKKVFFFRRRHLLLLFEHL